MLRLLERRVPRLVLSVLAVLIWFAIAGIGGPKIGELSSLQDNDQISALPDSVESSRVANELEKFGRGDTLPMLIVGGGDRTLSDQELRAAQGFAAELLDSELPQGIGTLRDYSAAPQLAAVPSKDGRAFLITVPLTADEVSDGEPSPLKIIADEVRARADATFDDTPVYITGPAGFVTDITAAFAGIDGVLLAVTLVVVFIILIVVYRSPVLPIAVLICAVFGLALAGLLVYFIASQGWISVNGQSQGILAILVVGAATDYSLLLVARYKEELHREQQPHRALITAWKASLAPISASAATVILGLLALTLAEQKGTAGLGPVLAIGVIGAYLVGLTLLPAFLALGGRWIFWPAKPRYDASATTDGAAHTATGVWHRLAGLIERRPRTVWTTTAAALIVASIPMTMMSTGGLSQADTFRTEVDSVVGSEILDEHFDGGSASPLLVTVDAAEQDAATRALATIDGLETVTVGATNGPPNPQPGDGADEASAEQPARVVDGRVLLSADVTAPTESHAATSTVDAARAQLSTAAPSARVGGRSAAKLDSEITANRDLLLVIPTIVLVVFIVLVLLLKSLVAPALLIAVNLLSFSATIGISALVFRYIFGFDGGEATTVLYAFVFLIALGVDYSIFLMTRAKEETPALGTRAAMLTALTSTGGVITSAGVVLAATFSALAVLPLTFMAQIAFLVGFGVLVDTLIVRSLLVPAVSVDLGEKTWWPRTPHGDHVIEETTD